MLERRSQIQPSSSILQVLMNDKFSQGFNARKVISEVYASFVLQCTVSTGGNVNTRRMSKPDMGSIFHLNNQWNILVIGNYYVNYQNYQYLMLLTSSDNTDASILVYKFRPERTGFNMYAENSELKLTFLAL